VGKYCGIGHVEHKFLEYCRYSRFEKWTFVRALFVLNRKEQDGIHNVYVPILFKWHNNQQKI
jgi:hypothetical protein